MFFLWGYLFPFSLVCILSFLLLPSLSDPFSFAYSLFIWNSMNVHSRVSVHADMLPTPHVLGTVKIHFPCLLVPSFILKSIFLALLKCTTLTIINAVKFTQFCQPRAKCYQMTELRGRFIKPSFHGALIYSLWWKSENNIQDPESIIN